jgi:hypothetical protein
VATTTKPGYKAAQTVPKPDFVNLLHPKVYQLQ